MTKVIFVMLGLGAMLIQLPAARATDAEVLEQRTQSFTISLKGSVADVTPLFGPVREAEWAPSWAPRFLHPALGDLKAAAA